MFDIKGYFEARTLAEAFECLENNNAQIIAGGTDVLIKTRERKNGYHGRELVSIVRIPELSGICETEEGIEIGACCSFTEIEKSSILCKHVPALSIGASMVGGPQVRNMGTLGGNIANGVPSADTAPALFCYNAIVKLSDKSGICEIPIRDFYTGPGKVKLEQGQIITSFIIKKEDYSAFQGHYIKFSRRKAMDISTLGCAAVVRMDGDKVADLRLAYGVAGPTPLRAVTAEGFAAGLQLNDKNLQEIGKKALLDCKARDSWRASKAFREALIVELAQRAVKRAVNGE